MNPFLMIFEMPGVDGELNSPLSLNDLFLGVTSQKMYILYHFSYMASVMPQKMLMQV